MSSPDTKASLVPYRHRLYAEAETALRTALTVGGVAHDVICEWLTLRISTAGEGTPSHPPTLLCKVQYNVISDFTL